jgi:hypothetical protein
MCSGWLRLAKLVLVAVSVLSIERRNVENAVFSTAVFSAL